MNVHKQEASRFLFSTQRFYLPNLFSAGVSWLGRPRQARAGPGRPGQSRGGHRHYCLSHAMGNEQNKTREIASEKRKGGQRRGKGRLICWGEIASGGIQESLKFRRNRKEEREKLWIRHFPTSQPTAWTLFRTNFTQPNCKISPRNHDDDASSLSFRPWSDKPGVMRLAVVSDPDQEQQLAWSCMMGS